MKAVILDPQVKVFASTDEHALSIATLQEGAEIDYGSTVRKGGKAWTTIVLSTGQQAFIPAETKIYRIREGTLMQDNVDLHTEPSEGSLIRQQLKRNMQIYILPGSKEQSREWVRVRDSMGNAGYISGNTRLRLASLRTKAVGKKTMLSGAMWLGAGLLWVFIESSSSSGSGMGNLGYFALVFGLGTFISGLIQFIRAPA